MTKRTSSAWTIRDIEDLYKEVETIGLEKFKLDIYPNQIEVISAEQMLDAYAFSGMCRVYLFTFKIVRYII